MGVASSSAGGEGRAAGGGGGGCTVALLSSSDIRRLLRLPCAFGPVGGPKDSLERSGTLGTDLRIFVYAAAAVGW